MNGKKHKQAHAPVQCLSCQSAWQRSSLQHAHPLLTLHNLTSLVLTSHSEHHTPNITHPTITPGITPLPPHSRASHTGCDTDGTQTSPRTCSMCSMCMSVHKNVTQLDRRQACAPVRCLSCRSAWQQFVGPPCQLQAAQGGCAPGLWIRV